MTLNSTLNETYLADALYLAFGDEISIHAEQKLIDLLQCNVVTNVLEQKVLDDTNIKEFCKILRSVKLILELIEWRLKKQGIVPDLSVIDAVLQCLRDVVDKQPNEQSVKISSEILYVICRFCTLHEDAIASLPNFYLYNLHLAQYSPSETDLRLRLKILNVLLHGLVVADPTDNSSRKFCDECRKHDSSVQDNELFPKLILNGSDSISAQTLLTVLPFYVRVFKNISLFLTIWNETLKITSTDDNVLKKYTALCFVFDKLVEGEETDGDDNCKQILEDERFWGNVQNGLTHLNQVIRKQALYLMKRSVQEMVKRKLTLNSYKLDEITGNNFSKKLDDGVIKLNNGLKNFTICDRKMFLVSSDIDSVVWWSPALAEELSSLFDDIFLVLETSEEKQSHIVKPVCSTMNRIIGAALSPFKNGKCLNFSWVLILLERLLQHDSSAVVRWSLTELMKVDVVLQKNDVFAAKIMNLLFCCLRKSNVFYGDTDSIRLEIQRYFEHISGIPSSKSRFQLIIEEICKLNWNPETLSIVLSALQDVKILALESEHLILIRTFVTSSIGNYYTFLRSAIQCQILSIIVNMTDISLVSLDALAEILGIFRRSESLVRGSSIWKSIAKWLEFCFSKRNAEDYILGNLQYSSESCVDSSTICRMVCLLYDAHLFGVNKCCGEAPSPRVIYAFQEILGAFKDADKRLYAAVDKLDYNLGIVKNIMEENIVAGTSEQTHLLELIVPYFTHILSYIEYRSSSLDYKCDFELSQTMISIIRNILITNKLFSINSLQATSSLFNYSVRVLGIINQEKKSLSVLENYTCMNYLSLILEYVYQDKSVPHLKMMRAYFKRFINVSLPKPEVIGLSSVWGRVNSDYLSAQWKVVSRLKNENLLKVGHTVAVEQFLTTDDLAEHCVAALQMGGGDILMPVMAIVEELLPELDLQVVEGLVNSCWNAVFETRKSELFAVSSRRFISLLYQPELVKRENCRGILLKYSPLLMSETINGLANAFMTQIQKLGVKYSPNPLFSCIIAEALVFGPIPRREDRLIIDVCSQIAGSVCAANELVTNEWNTGAEVRARSLQILLTLSPGSHTQFADTIAEALVEKEVSLTRGKNRYFGGSTVHLVRTRVLQALLIVEPLLSKERVGIIYKWLCDGIVKESHQPSVRYFTEWLIVRILWKNPDLQDSLWAYFNEGLDQRVGSLCSFISIVYHTMCILPDHILEDWMDRAVQLFLPYCLAQHFSLRLYAQVTLGKMWTLAEARGFKGILNKYQVVRDCLSKSIGNGNSLKNAEKLREDFYWTIFHPLQHFSLQTVFRDLPKLAHVKAEEWITLDIFKKVGVPITLKGVVWSSGDDLWHHQLATWNIRATEESYLDVSPDNFQRKMIPVKSLMPDYEEALDSSHSTTRKKQSISGGLIVVASLVERLPNLGGLSRTCEIFGVTELVLDSLTCLEDKTFQNLAVTAPKWITLREVKARYLLDFLTYMKNEGYTIVGAEQTSKSLPLHEVKFPRKSLLLLGSEKEGIPPQLLPVLDICVEIPQLGIIRSLNVHVAGALFIWEYAKQHSITPRSE